MRLALALLVALVVPAAAQDAVPLVQDPVKTPAPADPALTEAVICSPTFTTKTFRKASKADRRCVLERYGKPSYAYTYDHVVPLELGGSDGCDNLWPQPRAEAKRKDRLENALNYHLCVCHDVSLAEAQESMRRWIEAYPRFVDGRGKHAVCTKPTI